MTARSESDGLPLLRADGLHTMQTARSDRYVALDGLRGVAALFVALYHLQVSNHVTHFQLVRNGYLAVDLFFILSGFVICSTYSSRIASPMDVLRFIGFRFFRVYPMHLVTLLVLLGLEVLKLYSQHSGLISGGDRVAFTGSTSWEALLANLALIQGLGIFDSLTWNAPSWSISCEFAAYLVFAIAALTGICRSQRALLLLAAAGIVGYCFVAFKQGDLNSTYDFGIIRCLAGFFIGAAIFEISRRNTLQMASSGLQNAGQLFLCVAFLLVAGSISGSAIVTVVPIFIALVALLQFDKGVLANLLMRPAAQFLGEISYSVYMIHYVFLYLEAIVLKRVFGIPSVLDPVMHVPVFQTDPWTGDIILGASLAAIIATSACTFHLIETPARRWGRRLIADAFSSSRPQGHGDPIPTEQS